MNYPRTVILSVAQKSYGTKNTTPVSAQRPGLGELLIDQELKQPQDSFLWSQTL